MFVILWSPSWKLSLDWTWWVIRGEQQKRPPIYSISSKKKKKAINLWSAYSIDFISDAKITNSPNTNKEILNQMILRSENQTFRTIHFVPNRESECITVEMILICNVNEHYWYIHDDPEKMGSEARSRREQRVNNIYVNRGKDSFQLIHPYSRFPGPKPYVSTHQKDRKNGKKGKPRTSRKNSMTKPKALIDTQLSLYSWYDIKTYVID